jgi:hypothetical protein
MILNSEQTYVFLYMDVKENAGKAMTTCKHARINADLIAYTVGDQTASTFPFRWWGMNSTLSCAMKFMDGMGGNPLGFCQGAHEPLGLSRTGRSVSASSMPLKGTGEARGKPPRGRAWLRGRTVSAHEVDVNLRGTSPLSQDLA